MAKKVIDVVEWVEVRIGERVVGEREWLCGWEDMGEVVREFLEPYASTYDINLDELENAVKAAWRAFGGLGERVEVRVPYKGIQIVVGAYTTEFEVDDEEW